LTHEIWDIKLEWGSKENLIIFIKFFNYLIEPIKFDNKQKKRIKQHNSNIKG
jgi:hypothetical protein